MKPYIGHTKCRLTNNRVHDDTFNFAQSVVCFSLIGRLLDNRIFDFLHIPINRAQMKQAWNIKLIYLPEEF